MASRAGGLRPLFCAALFAPLLLCAQAGWCDSKAPRSRPTTRAATKPAKRLDPYAATLKEMGINADREGIGKFFREVHPSPAMLGRAEALIRQLGNPLWRQRQAATQELLKMPAVPVAMLRRATNDPDMEIRTRAKHVLDRRTGRTDRILHAVLRTIAVRKLRGLAPGVLKAIPLCADQYLVVAAGRALRATARTEDADLLRKALAGENVQVRIAAAGAIAHLFANLSPREVDSLLADREPRVALAAARELADRGDRRSLEAMLRLLSAKNISVRAESAVVLRALTGKNFRFAAYAPPADRAKTVAAWKKWIAAEGASARLHFPLRTTRPGVGDLHGNTLIAYGYANKVEELTPDGKVVWSCKAQGAWSAEKLPNGNVLIAAYRASFAIAPPGKVQEIDRKGKVVWELGVNGISAKPLVGGNVLIADYSGKQAIEVTRGKKIVWTYKTKTNCTDVQRLPNGNTLVTSMTRVEEVTPAGKVVWDWANRGRQVYSAQRLTNGNTLIALLGTTGVIEITKAKKTHWRYQAHAVDAFRLPNGNTLITLNKKVIEVTPAKKIVWEHAGLSYGSARR